MYLCRYSKDLRKDTPEQQWDLKLLRVRPTKFHYPIFSINILAYKMIA